MLVPIDRTKVTDRIHASLAVFTFVPFVRRADVRHAETAVECWPIVGWTTGAFQALVLLVAAPWLPWLAAIALALLARVLLCPKPRLLPTKGMNWMGVAIYELLLSALLLRLEPFTAAAVLFAAAPYAHMVCAQMVAMLPYREAAETNPWHIAFRKYSTASGLWLFAQGILPMAVAIYVAGVNWQWMVFAPCLVMYFSYLFLLRRLGGYTVDALIAVSALLEAVVCWAAGWQ